MMPANSPDISGLTRMIDPLGGGGGGGGGRTHRV